MKIIIDVLMNVLLFISQAFVTVIGFFATLIQDNNYIALGAIFVALALIAKAIGKGYKKLRLTR